MNNYKVVKGLENIKSIDKGDYFLIDIRGANIQGFINNKKLQVINDWDEIVKNLNEEDLLKILFDKTYFELFHKLIPEDNICIKNRDFNYNLEIRNHNFESIKKSLKFYNCKFYDSVEIVSKLDKNDLTLQFDSCNFFKNDLIISNSIFYLNISNSKLNDLRVSQDIDNVLIKKLIIYGNQINRVNFVLNLVFHCNQLLINENKKINEIKILNFKAGNTNSEIQFNKNKYIGEITFLGSKGSVNFQISENKKITKFQFLRCNIRVFQVQNNNKIDNLLIKNKNIFKEEVELLSNNITNLDISDKNEFEKRLKISTIENSEERKRQEINNFYFKNNFCNDIRIGHTNFKEFCFKEIRNEKDNEINIGAINILEKLQFDNFRNYGEFKFYSLNWDLGDNNDTHLIFSNSSFGTAEFLELNLKYFNKAQIYSSNMIHIDSLDVKWPQKIIAEDEKSLEKARNTYRMLKLSMLNQEDKIQALEFHSKEMNVYYNQLNKESSNIQEKITLAFNKNTNNFGMDWVSPIIIMFFINAIFILMYNLLNPVGTFPNISHIYDFDVYNPEIFIENLVFYISDVIRSFYFISGINYIVEEPNRLTLTIEFLRKIFMSIMTYQTIIAFRKYSRKI